MPRDAGHGRKLKSLTYWQMWHKAYEEKDPQRSLKIFKLAKD